MGVKEWRIQRRGPGGPPHPLFLDQTDAILFFGDPPPPAPLSQGAVKYHATYGFGDHLRQQEPISNLTAGIRLWRDSDHSQLSFSCLIQEYYWKSNSLLKISVSYNKQTHVVEYSELRCKQWVVLLAKVRRPVPSIDA